MKTKNETSITKNSKEGIIRGIPIPLFKRRKT